MATEDKEKKSTGQKVFEAVEGEIAETAKGYFQTKFKDKLIKYGEISILALLGFLMISIGIAEVIATYIHQLSGGFSYLVLGILLLLAALLLKM